MERLDLDRLARHSRRAFDLHVTTLADGGPVAVPVTVVTGSSARPRLSLIAGVHGDEAEGIMALSELAGELEPERVRGQVLIVPVAHPRAFGAGQRASPLDGLDLNRVFPGEVGGRPTERLAHKLFADVVLGADFVLTLHSWYSTGTTLPFVEVSAADGAVAAAARRATVACGFERIRRLHWPEGVLVRAADERGIPSLEAEVGGMGTSTAENRAYCRARIAALMQHLGMLDGAPPANGAAELFEGRHVLAPAGGMMRRRRGLGEEAREGDVLATIHDLHGAPVAEVTSPWQGIVVAHRTFASVGPGDNLFTIFSPIGRP